MKKYLFFFLWLVATLTLGIFESALSIPVFSIGLLLFLSKNVAWWLRVTALTLAAIVWGTAMAIAPFVLLIVLASAYWLNRWLAQKTSTTQALMIVVVVTVVCIGSLAQLPISFWSLVLLSIQLGLFWSISRYLPRLHAPIQFAIPVASVRKLGDDVR